MNANTLLVLWYIHIPLHPPLGAPARYNTCNNIAWTEASTKKHLPARHPVIFPKNTQPPTPPPPTNLPI